MLPRTPVSVLLASGLAVAARLMALPTTVDAVDMFPVGFVDSYAAGPRDLLLADINGDGHLDAVGSAFVERYSREGVVGVVLGRGDGTFGDAISVGMGLDPGVPFAADCDGDGRLDIAFTSAPGPWGYMGAIQVFWQRPDGTFDPLGQEHTDLPGYSLLRGLGDVTGDGLADVVFSPFSSSSASDSLYLAVATPNRTFEPRTLLAVGVQWASVADVDGDGRTDIQYLATSPGGRQLGLLAGLPGGGLAPPFLQPFDSSGDVLAVNDVTGDGRADLVASDGRIAVQTPSGAYSWGPPVFSGSAVTVGDIDGDGLADLVAAGQVPYVELLYLDGQGGVRRTESRPMSFINRVAVGDVLEDGRDDLVLLRPTMFGQGVLSVVPSEQLAQPQWALESPALHAPNSLALGDLNEDGHFDIITTGEVESSLIIPPFGFPEPSSTFEVHVSGSGSLGGPQAYTLQEHVLNACLGDLNDDGHLDVVVGGAQQGAVFWGDGFGGLASGPTLASGGPVAIGDLDGDGHPDAVVLGAQMEVYWGTGTTALTGPTAFALPNTFDKMAVADLNLDGRADVLLARSGELDVLLALPSRMFAPPVLYSSEGASRTITLGHLDADATLDVMVGRTAWLGSGDGTLHAPPPVLVLPAPSDGGIVIASVIADLTGDGRADVATVGLAASGSSRDNVEVWIGTPEGFEGPHRFGTGPGPQAIRAADMNGDGLLDLVIANYYGSSLSVLCNNSATPSDVAASGGSAKFKLFTPVARGGGSVELRFAAQRDVGEVRATVFDVRGRHLQALGPVVGTPGTHSLLWDRQTAAGPRASRGVYLIEWRAKDVHATQKLCLH